ncbi:MAG: hypothetical protein BGO67_01905 [Alphaproteobacteria bacterium 41-28]|nr:MAG: hypothetical protein BGO67_01905 [Alphaproteobacteria bacterium 41-28]
MQLKTRYLFLSFFFFFTVVQPAHAYLDPGAASMVLQGLIGGVAAAVGFLSLYYNRIKKFLCNLRKRKE